MARGAKGDKLESQSVMGAYVLHEDGARHRLSGPIPRAI